MDGFLKEDFVGSVRKGMTMDQIVLNFMDNMVQRQLRMMQEDYERCQKYEDPSYKGEEIVLKGKFETTEIEDGTQFKDDTDQKVENKITAEPDQKQETKQSEDDANNENSAKKVKKNDDEEGDSDEDDNRCIEDYYQPLDNDANGQEDDEEDEQVTQQNGKKFNKFITDYLYQKWTDFKNVEDFKDLPPERDPRKKEIDVEKIRQIMSSFTLKPPAWAQDKNIWEQKVQGLISEIQK